MSAKSKFEFEVYTDGTVGITGYNGNDAIVEIPSTIEGKTVTEIREWAFIDCNWVTNVTIPDSVEIIGEFAFNGCTKLTSVTIGKGIISIGNGAFVNTGYGNNPSNWEDGVLYIGDYLIDANLSVSGNYVVKDGTRLIAECAFWGCTRLTGVVIPSSVTHICDYAFRYCTNLVDILSSDGLEYLGFGIDINCDKLEHIAWPNSVKKVGNAIVNN